MDRPDKKRVPVECCHCKQLVALETVRYFDWEDRKAYCDECPEVTVYILMVSEIDCFSISLGIPG
jgi:hypothetical protein